MTLLETATWTDDDWTAFIDECFAQWLNKIDARIGYDVRNIDTVATWRALFDEGMAESEAIEALQAYAN